MVVDYDGEVPTFTVQTRLHDGGHTFMPGDTILLENTTHERIIFLMSKDIIMPDVEFLEDLPEPMFTDLMELRD